jgi:hypothetical protein
MLPADWYPHRRDDGEVVGYIRPDGDRWVAVSLLGRAVTGPVEWLDAEAALEATGLAFLAGVWELEGVHPSALRVKIVEVTPERVVVQTDDFGAIDAPVERIRLPWPAPDGLRPAAPGAPGPSPFG